MIGTLERCFGCTAAEGQALLYPSGSELIKSLSGFAEWVCRAWETISVDRVKRAMASNGLSMPFISCQYHSWLRTLLREIQEDLDISLHVEYTPATDDESDSDLGNRGGSGGQNRIFFNFNIML